MSTTEQMSFGFDSAPQDVAPAPALPVAKSKPTAKPALKVPSMAAPTAELKLDLKTTQMAAQVAATAETLSHDAMARALDAHPDYKVLRRLVPRDDWGPVPASGTQRVIVLDTETTGLDAKNERIIELRSEEHTSELQSQR